MQSIPDGFKVNKETKEITLLDQTCLPLAENWLTIPDLETAKEAILKLRIRGAPAIALFSAYVLAQEMDRFIGQPEYLKDLSNDLLENHLVEIQKELIATRPTAVNLSNAMVWILEQYRIRRPIVNKAKEQKNLVWFLADELYEEDIKLCEQMGKHGASLIVAGSRVLTHCNTGALATAGLGTAIAAFYTAHTRSLENQEAGIRVYADETRPLLQGARLTAWELQKAGLDVHLITDGMAAHLMQRGDVDLVMVGADRITTNGDTANKIGTLGLAVLCKYFKIPFYVVAPHTSIDLKLKNGMDIEIEMRDPNEVRTVFGHQVAPADINVINPAFDVTPAELITAIVTESGIHRAPYHFT